MDTFEIIKQLALALILGGIVGYERERAHKMAGIRTHALIALGAALLTLLSVHGFSDMPEGFRYDPGRIISTIIVGIGFIGGGAILRKGNQVMGITTASSLWIVAIIGIAVGMSYNTVAILATLGAFLVLSVIWKIETHIESSPHFGETVEEINDNAGQNDD